ncbi:MAG: VOC family protein [Dehalococcoidia bacterium]
MSFFTCIDHLAVAAGGSDVEQATAPFRRLGIGFVPPRVRPGEGITAMPTYIGAGLEAVVLGFRALTNREEALHAGPHLVKLVEAVDQGHGLFAVELGCEDAAVESAVRAWRTHGLEATVSHTTNRFGETMPAVYPHLPAVAAVNFNVLGGRQMRRASRSQMAFAPSSFPLKRLDHLTAIAPDLDATTHFWTEVLDLQVADEVRTPTTIIRQFKIGDAIIELLGPATPDSLLAQRPPGLLSMIACEVVDIDAAVAQARTAGFTVADATPGALPHTRVTSIPGSELSGLTLQLLEYG